MRIALGVEYCGTAFHGWQSQAGGGTVQDALESALREIAGMPVGVMCAGRTDAGVHASHQVVHFETSVDRPLTAWVRGVNSNLPAGVAVRWAQAVDDEFHARFSARGRRYRYLLLNRQQRPGLWAGRVGWFHGTLELAAMQDACGQLLGEHDFSAFRAAGCQAKSPVKTLARAEVWQCGNMFVFDFEASAFLHHMVRNARWFLGLYRQGYAVAWLDRRIAANAGPQTGGADLFAGWPVFPWPDLRTALGMPDPDDDFLDGLLK